MKKSTPFLFLRHRYRLFMEMVHVAGLGVGPILLPLNKPKRELSALCYRSFLFHFFNKEK